MDIAGIVDPTPISDGSNALISIARGRWLDAGLNAISIIPYIGDAAKVGKLGSYAQTVAHAVEAAARNPALRASLESAVRNIGKVVEKLPLDKLPEGVRRQLHTIRELTHSFGKTGHRKMAAAETSSAHSSQALATQTPRAAHATAVVAKTGDRRLFKAYLNDIAAQTGRAVTPAQQQKISEFLSKADTPHKLSPAESRAHRAQFNRVKNDLIAQWEKHIGEKWPRYTEPVMSSKGEVVRKPGQPYDAHHIVESSYGGPAEWWNIHPAKFPNEHQGGIHRAAGPAEQVFP